MSGTYLKVRDQEPVSYTHLDVYKRQKLDAYVNYSRTFAEKHSLSAMAGYSYSRDKTNAFAASAEGGGSDLTPTLTAQPDRTSSTSSFSEIVMHSYFGRIDVYKRQT